MHRLSVTAWVEACWTFNLPPNLSRLKPLLNDLCVGASTQTVEGREVWWVAAGLTQLGGALNELREKHASVLSSNPTLIWQQHIVSATDPGFWPVWKLEQQHELNEDESSIRVRAGFNPRYELAPAPSNSNVAIPMFL